MNHSYLMRHISYHLHTFVRRYSADFAYIENFCGRMQLQDCLAPDDLMSCFTSRKDISLEYPVLLSFGGEFLYALLPVPGSYYILGPVRFADAVYLCWQAELPPVDAAWIQTVPVCGFKELTADVLLMFNLCREEALKESSLVAANCIRRETDAQLKAHFSELVFENQEQGRRHNPYDQEYRECSSIEQGDLKRLETAIREDYLGGVWNSCEGSRPPHEEPGYCRGHAGKPCGDSGRTALRDCLPAQ